MLSKTFIFFAAALAAASASIAVAQDEDAAIEAVIGCREISDTDARLKCMDKAAKTLSETRVISTTDAEALAKPAMETPDQFGNEAMPSERKKRESNKLKSITEKIAEVAVRPNKRVVITLENGQKWRQLDSDDKSLPTFGKKKFYTATVKRGMFGNYMLTVKEMKRSIRVERIE